MKSVAAEYRSQSSFGKTVGEDVCLSTASGIRFERSRFWVTHRHREYGPFDYEWSKDFCGVELLYQGRKFGEYCSAEEIFADLKQFKLPMTVVRVTTVVMGSQLYGLLNGLSGDEKAAEVVSRLNEYGYDRFAQNISKGGEAA